MASALTVSTCPQMAISFASKFIFSSCAFSQRQASSFSFKFKVVTSLLSVRRAPLYCSCSLVKVLLRLHTHQRLKTRQLSTNEWTTVKKKKRKKKRTYLRKVKKTWRSQFFYCLLGIRIQVRVLDDWLNHLNGVACSLCVRRQQKIHWVMGPVTIIKPLRRWQLLWFVACREGQSFLEWTVVLLLALSFGQPFGDALGS